MLLSYATYAMFGHALLAHDDGVDPTGIIDRFSNKHIWDRWRALREDVPREIEFLDYVMEMGLSSWVNLLSNHASQSHGQQQGALKIPLPSMSSALSSAEDALPRIADTEISYLTQDIVETAHKALRYNSADCPNSSFRTGSHIATHAELEGLIHRSSYENIFQSPALTSLKRGRSPSIISRRQSPTIYSYNLPNGHSPQRGTSPQSFSLMLRRRESVASFSSAGSHDNQELYPRTTKPIPQVDQKGPEVWPQTKDDAFFLCECYPKKPKRFTTIEDLT